MCRKFNDITKVPIASTCTTILPTIRLLDLLIAFTTPNRGIPYKNSQYCVKISFWFTISQSILFKAIAGHSSLSIAVHTHTHTCIHIFIYTYTYSIYCLLFFLLSCFAIFGFETKSKAISLCRLIVKNWQAAVSQSNVNCVRFLREGIDEEEGGVG